MRITWIGGPTTLLELGAFRVVTDPVFSDRLELPDGASSRSVAVPDVTLDDVHAICLTSIRPDHFDSAAAARIGTGMPVFVPAGAGEVVRAAGFGDVRELSWYGDTKLESSGEALTITAVPAQSPSGPDNGWFFRHDAGGDPFSAYCTGDAVWSDEIRKVQRELGYSNLLIQHVGAERSVDGRLASPDGKEAMQFVYRMQPNAIIPVHYNTYSHYGESVDVFIDNIGRTIYDRRLHVLAEGESWEK
jgi:L-ascorbate metabolism protein UlaG (beta-lactamase superfamily)